MASESEIFFITNELLSEYIESPKTEITLKILDSLTGWRNCLLFKKEINSPLSLRIDYVNCVYRTIEGRGSKVLPSSAAEKRLEKKIRYIRPEFSDTRTLGPLSSKV